jgi:hypothetical protein
MKQRFGKANSTSDRHRRWRAKMMPSAPPGSTLIRIHDCADDALWVLAAVSALLFLYNAVHTFPNARLIAAQQLQDAIGYESRASVKNREWRSAPREHTLCAADLVDIRAIRANERQRTLDDSGIF